MQGFIVLGLCDKKIKFRPSDWTERLVSSYTTNQKVRECVSIINVDGIKGIQIKECLTDVDPVLLNHILDFASMHNLVIKYINVKEQDESS